MLTSLISSSCGMPSLREPFSPDECKCRPFSRGRGSGGCVT
jgi:hypothetical protein